MAGERVGGGGGGGGMDGSIGRCRVNKCLIIL